MVVVGVSSNLLNAKAVISSNLLSGKVGIFNNLRYVKVGIFSSLSNANKAGIFNNLFNAKVGIFSNLLLNANSLITFQWRTLPQSKVLLVLPLYQMYLLWKIMMKIQ